MTLKDLFEKLKTCKIVEIDIETNGLDVFQENARIKCISFSFEEKKAITLPLIGWPTEQREWIRVNLKQILENPKIGKSGALLGFEYKWLKHRENIELRGIAWDTVIGSYEEDKLSSHSIKEAAWRVGMGGYEQEFPQGKDLIDFEGPDLYRYCAMDSDCSHRERLRQQSVLSPKLKEYIQKQALPLIPIYTDMHLRGLRVDMDKLEVVEKLSEELIKYLEGRIQNHKYIKRFRNTSPHDKFNPRSARHVRFLLYAMLGAKVIKTSPGGAPSTDEETLKRIADDYPSVINPILDYRTATKSISTYVKSMRKHIANDGRIHSTISQTITTSGRSASNTPNIQNWPSKKDYSERYPERFLDCFNPKNFIIPDNGCTLLSADFSQQELRVAAAISGDPVMAKIFAGGGDIHRETALLFNRDYDNLDPVNKETIRRFSKTINFGIIYGMSAYELAKRTGMSENKAKDFISGMFRKYWGFAKWIDYVKEFVKSHGYVEYPTGRIRNFPPLEDLDKKDVEAIYREAINAPIQGTAYDLCAAAMIRFSKVARRMKLKTYMLNTIHDSVLFNVPLDEKDTVIKIFTEIAINPPEWLGEFLGTIPLIVDWSEGGRWGEMGKVK